MNGMCLCLYSDALNILCVDTPRTVCVSECSCVLVFYWNGTTNIHFLDLDIFAVAN